MKKLYFAAALALCSTLLGCAQSRYTTSDELLTGTKPGPNTLYVFDNRANGGALQGCDGRGTFFFALNQNESLFILAAGGSPAAGNAMLFRGDLYGDSMSAKRVARFDSTSPVVINGTFSEVSMIAQQVSGCDKLVAIAKETGLGAGSGIPFKGATLYLLPPQGTPADLCYTVRDTYGTSMCTSPLTPQESWARQLLSTLGRFVLQKQP